MKYIIWISILVIFSYSSNAFKDKIFNYDLDITSSIDPLLSEDVNDKINKWKNYLKQDERIGVLVIRLDTNNISRVGTSFYNALSVFNENIKLLSQGVSSSDYMVRVKSIRKTKYLFEDIENAYKGKGKLFMKIAINDFLVIKIGSYDLRIETSY